MKSINIWESLPGEKKSIITLGKFDGLHKGHRKLIAQMQRERNENLKSVIFIFNAAARRILSEEERRVQLEELDIDYLAECQLDEKFRHMSAEEFVKKILVQNLRAAKVVVGEDYRFGYQRKGTTDLLKKLGEDLGFEVELVSHEMDGHRKISSTLVREQLNEGNMEKVKEYLGREFIASGEVLHGRGLGHRKLLPTTNLIPPKEKLMPPNGVYITVSIFDNKQYGGITNVGYKPTVGGEAFLGVETYLFGCEENLYGKETMVKFLKFLRPERQFDSLEALKQQLLLDAKKGKEYFQQ